MTATIPAYIARTQMGSLLKEISRRRARFLITKNGQPAAVLLSAADFDDIVEELDPEFQRSLERARHEHRRGQSISLNDYLKERIKKGKTSR